MNELKEHDSFVFYRSYYDSIYSLQDDRDRLELLKCICQYAFTGTMYESEKDYINSIFAAHRINIDKSIERRNKNRENGLKGGAPIGNKNSRHKRTQPKTTDINPKQANHNLNVNVNGNENINVDENIEILSIPSSHKGTPVISLPLNKAGTFKNIYEEDLVYYSGLYPNVAIMQEFRNMVGWLNANPTKKKTVKGIDKFITNWLMGKQDEGTRNHDRRSSKGSLSIEDMQSMKEY